MCISSIIFNKCVGSVYKFIFKCSTNALERDTEGSNLVR